MFNNIGGKIKSVAKVLTGLGITVSVLVGIMVMTSDMLGVGLLTIVLGSLLSWLSSFTLYGFGQLIENTDTLVKLQAKKTDSSPEPDEDEEEEEPEFQDYDFENCRRL